MTGREGWAPEAGCNCEHLDDSATCVACALKRAGDNPQLLFCGSDRDDSDVLTDGGVEVDREDVETSGAVDEEIISDLMMSCRLAKERGMGDGAVLAALDGVASVQNEQANIPEYLILRERFGVDIRDAGARTLEELVDEVEDQRRAWYDPRGWC